MLHEPQGQGEDQQAMPQPVTVNVKPVFGTTVCEIDAGDGPSHSFVHGGVISLHGNSSFNVTWQLVQSPTGMAFDTANPVWSSQSGCPNSFCQDAQISVVSCNTNTLVTTVTPQRPPNAVHVSLGWADGSRFDPIIVNN
jgi:hypothetical protein